MGLQFRDRELLAFDVNPGVASYPSAAPESNDTLLQFNLLLQQQDEEIERSRRDSIQLKNLLAVSRASINALESLALDVKPLTVLSPTAKKLLRWARGIHVMQFAKRLAMMEN